MAAFMTLASTEPCEKVESAPGANTKEAEPAKKQQNWKKTRQPVIVTR